MKVTSPKQAIINRKELEEMVALFEKVIVPIIKENEDAICIHVSISGYYSEELLSKVESTYIGAGWDNACCFYGTDDRIHLELYA